MDQVQFLNTKSPRVRQSDVAELDLPVLATLDVATLGERYREASRPTSVDALVGNPRGRMLAVRALDQPPMMDVLRLLARDTRFPWGGKSFSGTGQEGRGANRVRLLGRHQLFPFATYVRPSVIDGEPCIALDYDLPDNPSLIRSIHDEVREVSRGLYLGPAMWKRAPGHAPTLLLWFGLDTREQDRPVGVAHAS